MVTALITGSNGVRVNRDSIGQQLASYGSGGKLLTAPEEQHYGALVQIAALDFDIDDNLFAAADNASTAIAAIKFYTKGLIDKGDRTPGLKAKVKSLEKLHARFYNQGRSPRKNEATIRELMEGFIEQNAIDLAYRKYLLLGLINPGFMRNSSKVAEGIDQQRSELESAIAANDTELIRQLLIPSPMDKRMAMKARDTLTVKNLKLVVSVANKYNDRGVEFSDLLTEGAIGLMRGVGKFDPIPAYRFSTYAYWWIRQALSRAVITYGRTVRIPVHLYERLTDIKYAIREIRKKGQSPTIDAIAQHTGFTPEQVREYMAHDSATQPRSIDAKVRDGGSGKDATLSELLPSSGPTPDDVADAMAIADCLQLIIDTAGLRPLERVVISERYGLTTKLPPSNVAEARTGKRVSLGEIGTSLNLSTERVRQLEKTALGKLRRAAIRSGIKPEVLG